MFSRTLLTVCLLGAVLLFARDYRFFKNPQSPRQVQVDASEQNLLFKDGQVLFEIVYGKTSVAKFGAEELARQLSRVLGAPLTPLARRTGTKPALIVGDQALARQNGMDPDVLDRDGFFIRSIGRDVLLIGADSPNADAWNHGYFERGSLFAVYDFLERFAGVRYYFPGEMGTVAPHRTEWSLPRISIVDRPDSQYRQIYSVYNGPKEQAGQFLYSGYNGKDHYRDREYQLRLLTHPMHSTHGLAYLGHVERFGKEHPEYFALADNGKRYNGKDVVRCPSDLKGQLCFSQEGLKDEVVKDGIALLSGKGAASRGAVNKDGQPFVTMRDTQRPFFCIMPNDSAAACFCPDCAPYMKNYAKGKPDQDCSDFFWRWMIDVAKRIQDSGVDGYVTTMAYNPYHLLPPEQLPSNVIVRLALPGPWVKQKRWSQDMQTLNAWYDKSGGRIALWIYMINGGTRNHHEIPHFTPVSMGRYMKDVARHSFGTFMECENQNYLGNYLSYYLFSRVSWDENTDVDAVLSEHDALMFGSAAATMKAVRERWERNWLDKIVGNVMDTPLGPVNVTPSKTELWEKIYNKAELDGITALFDKAERECAQDAEALARVKFIRQEVWQRTLDCSSEFWKQFDDRMAWQLTVPECQGTMTIDGKLDEEDWSKAQTVWLLPRKTSKNIPDEVEVQTKVRVLRDKENFYVGFECEEPYTDKLSHVKRNFDDGAMWVDNIAELFLTPGPKDTLIYQFMVTSNNSACDLRTYQGQSTEYAWNSGMVSQVSIQPGKAWFAEIKIPRNAMPELKGDCIAGNFTRGRKLIDSPVAVKIPYYTWSPAFIRQIPENCGRFLLSGKQEESIVLDGGFSIPMRWTKAGYPSPWYGPSGVWVDFDAKDFRTNGASVIMNKKQNVLTQYLPAIKPDTKYRLSFYLKLKDVAACNANGGFFMRLGFLVQSQGSVYPLNRALVGNSPWRRYVFEVKTPKDIGDPKKAAICFYFRDATGEARLDEVRLVELKP